jgi:hypothetical protein
MKKNQMRTPGPRTCDIRASLLPLLYSSAMGEASRPSGPGVRSMWLRRKAAFCPATFASRSRMAGPGCVFLKASRASSSMKRSTSASMSTRRMPHFMPSGTS